MGIGNDRIWERTCKLLGLEELLGVEAYKTNENRKIHRSEIVSRLEEVLRTKDTQYWFEYLSENGVPCGPINYIDNVVEDPHIRSRGMFFNLEDEELGTVPQVGSPWKLGQTREKTHKAPPRVGEHDEEVYREWLGMDPEDLERLRKSEIIR
jgi:crotonobetainyl-CoA:carnitine CoA-transferase CaiB-like acyl-CoA transferase